MALLKLLRWRSGFWAREPVLWVEDVLWALRGAQSCEVAHNIAPACRWPPKLLSQRLPGSSRNKHRGFSMAEVYLAVQPQEAHRCLPEDEDAYVLLMPEDTYGAMLVAWGGLRKGESMCCDFLVVLASHILHLGIQVVLLLALFHEVFCKMDACSIEATSGLREVCCTVFVGEMVQEIDACKALCSWVRNPEINANDRRLMSLQVLVVVVPKALLVAASTYIGSSFVALSQTNADMILNTVAMTFVNNIDNAIFRILSPQRLKNRLTSFRTTAVAPKTPLYATWRASAWILVVFISIMVFTPRCKHPTWFAAVTHFFDATAFKKLGSVC
ncbi:unnamed protein product [Symbiodinium natans]|uniref:Uncharacterized protein n=1 Tax=Symbiodinium natans TaxID=878477 RepID=A0A812LN95_9DINO|nr:unnamed protein product [Symbiodinium natans]